MCCNKLIIIAVNIIEHRETPSAGYITIIREIFYENLNLR
jgi:hypothetical protein